MFVFPERAFQVTDIRLHMGSPDQVFFFAKKVFFAKQRKKMHFGGETAELNIRKGVDENLLGRETLSTQQGLCFFTPHNTTLLVWCTCSGCWPSCMDSHTITHICTVISDPLCCVKNKPSRKGNFNISNAWGAYFFSQKKRMA